MNTNDLALLDRWRRQRDAEAFRELVARHAGMVYGTCCRILGNATDAEDVTQDCFLQLAQRPLRPKRSVGGWLHALATHRALDRMKAESRRRAREERFGNAPEPQRERESLSDHVDEALAALDEMQRTLLVLHFFEGHSHDEIARGLDVSRSTVTRRIADGVEQVRTRLRAKGVTIPSAALAAALIELKAEALPATLAMSLGKIAIAGGGSAASAAGASIMLKVIAATVAMMLAVGGAVVVWQAPQALPAQLQAAVVESPATEQESETTGAVASPATSVGESPMPDAALTPSERRIEETSSPSPTTGALVEGVVLDLGQTPVSNARVDCYGAGVGFRGSTQIFTDERGRFQYNDVPPTDVFYVYASTDDPPRRTKQETLETIGAGERYNVRLTLDEARVSGQVVDAEGRAARDAEVMAQPVDYFSFGLPTARTDATGRFTIAGLAEGEYTLKANWDGGRTPWPEDGIHVVLASNESREGFRLVLGEPAGLTIAGRVTDASGSGVNDVHVQCSGRTPEPVSTWARTDSDGFFVVSGLTEGVYMLQLSHPHYGSIHARDIATGTQDSTFQLEPRGSVAGTVVDAATGMPIREFEVFEAKPISDLHHHMVTEHFRHVSDPQGRFAIEDVGPGDTPIRVRARGYVNSTETVDVPSGQAAAVRIALSRGQRIHGRVVDESDQPVAGALIFSGKLPSTWMTFQYDEDALRSDERGEFEFESVDSSIGVSCYHPQFAPSFSTVSLDNDPQVMLRLEKGVEVRGRVLLDGAAPAGARVSIIFPELMEGGMHHAGVGADGTYSISAVPRALGFICLSKNHGDSGPDVDVSRTFSPETAGESITIDVDVSRGTGSVEGIVYEGGTPRGGLYMVLQMDEHDGWTQTYSTHAAMGDGAYRIDNVPAGNGVVRVYPIGAPQERDAVEIPVVVREGEVVTCDVEIPAE